MNTEMIIKIGAVCGAILGIYAFINRVVLWIDNQKKQDARIDALEAKHNSDISKQNEELQLLTYSILVVLKSAQGDKSEVPNAVSKIEKHLNAKAHQQGE